jgi:hypothetical protein
MAENKTRPTRVSATAFLKAKSAGQQLKDSQELLKLFRELTGKPPKMWGPQSRRSRRSASDIRQSAQGDDRVSFMDVKQVSTTSRQVY